MFPNWDHAGRPNYQIKPDHEQRRTIIGEDGSISEPKYEQCGGTRVSVYVPHRVRPWLLDRTRDLWATEGSKKVMAGVSAGLCIVGLSGVDCWSYKPNPADKTELGDRGRVASEPLPDWEHIALRGRRVFVAFDSDAMTKDTVQWALQAFPALPGTARGDRAARSASPTARTARSGASTITSRRRLAEGGAA